MPPALELTAAQATFTNNVLTALVANTGQTLVIRGVAPTADVRLLSMWALTQAGGVFRIRSPRLHDNVNGIRMLVRTTAPIPMITPHPVQRLYAQDALIPEIAVADAAGNIELGFFLAYYTDLQGVAARFIDWPTLMARGVNLVGVEVDTTPGVTGQWTGASALNKTVDNLIANTDYAILGYTLSARCGGVGITGVDTGNLRVGGPGQVDDPVLLQEWFSRLSRLSGIPCIPVINSANKAGITIDIAQDQAGAAVNVALQLVQLVPTGQTSPTARQPGP